MLVFGFLSKRQIMKRAIVAIAVVLAAVGGGAYAKTIYVDGRAGGANNGMMWATAYKFLQDALTDADSSEKPVEIRVAQGVYQPDRRAAEPNSTGDRMATFRLINGVTIQGGYAGLGHQDPNARDIELYETILSGDLDSNDFDVNDPADLRDEPSRGENAYHVVTGSGTEVSAVLDGFTITGGNANGYYPDPPPYQDSGGGMYNKGGGGVSGGRGTPLIIEYAATISNCTFIANSATVGGGMYNYYSYPKVSCCSFIGNSAALQCLWDYCWGGQGGAVYNEKSSPMVVDCVFSGNSAPAGAGIFNYESDPIVGLCTFSGNFGSFASDGGGIYNYKGSPTVYGCLFNKNRVSASGGAMVNSYGNPLVMDCIFIENFTFGSGGAIYNTQSEPTITLCTLAGNSCNSLGGAISNSRSNVILSNCVLAGNWARWYGGSIDNMIDCQTTIVNCAVIENRAGKGAGGIRCEYESDVLVNSSILWGNSALEGPQVAIMAGTSTLMVAYSVVMGGKESIYVGSPDGLYWGAGNIECDPCFADLGYWDPNGTPEDNNDDFWVMGDYHLKSQAGRWDPNAETWVIDNVTSPCIDAGDPMTPIGLEPFPNGGRVNMGAYGGTAEASKSYFGDAPCETIVAGDVNGDCNVDFLDFAIMAIHWLEEH